MHPTETLAEGQWCRASPGSTHVRASKSSESYYTKSGEASLAHLRLLGWHADMQEVVAGGCGEKVKRTRLGPRRRASRAYYRSVNITYFTYPDYTTSCASCKLDYTK